MILDKINEILKLGSEICDELQEAATTTPIKQVKHTKYLVPFKSGVLQQYETFDSADAVRNSCEGAVDVRKVEWEGEE